ncbi:MAG: S8 family serine peptidase [Planctomycetes bacterium]|nr:S8 family serine peptidase [Planctomycetota bacterium]
MPTDLRLHYLFVELSAEDAQAAGSRAVEDLGVLGYRAWPANPLADPDTPGRFGVELRPPPALGITPAEAWDLAHALRAELGGEGARVEPVFAGDLPIQDEAVTESTDSSGPPPADPLWDLELVHARDAWERFQGRVPGAEVLVGHPDTGYRNHPELRDASGSLRVRADLARNLVEEASAEDPLHEGVGLNPGHGTGTGSLIVSPESAAIAGQKAVAGLAPGAWLVPIRVTDSVVVLGWQDRLARAIEYATEAGCQVISISLGGLGGARLLRAVRYARRSGVIVVAAAGNSVGFVVWPALYPEVLAVAACGPGAVAWSGSSRGKAVDLTAPGHLLYVAAWQGGAPITRPGSGTSHATARVAAAAALWLSFHGVEKLRARYPGAELPAAFAEILRRTATTPIGTPLPPSWFGSGLLDCDALLTAALPDLGGSEEAVAVRGGDGLRALEGMVLGELARDVGSEQAAQRALRRWVRSAVPTSAPGPEADPLVAELTWHAATDPAFRRRIVLALMREMIAAGDRNVFESVPATSQAIEPPDQASRQLRVRLAAAGRSARAARSSLDLRADGAAVAGEKGTNARAVGAGEEPEAGGVAAGGARAAHPPATVEIHLTLTVEVRIDPRPADAGGAHG